MIDCLNALTTKLDFMRYGGAVKKFLGDDRKAKAIFHVIKRHYDMSSDPISSWNVFKAFYFVTRPQDASDERRPDFVEAFDYLEAQRGSKSNDALMQQLLERYYAEAIGMHALQVAEGSGRELSTVMNMYDEYMIESGKAATIGNEANRKNATELLQSTSHGTGLEWRLTALRESLGTIHRGNFILFAGRPDSGKTSLLVSEAAYMAQQLPDGEQVIYFTNEEGGDAVKLRFMCAVLGATRATIEKDPVAAWDNYLVALKGDPDKILIIDKYDLHIRDIESWLQRENPGLICIDQLRKVHGFDSIKGVNRLEKLFNQGREWSKHYAPLLTVTQLDALADDEQYPGMARLYESKTAVQGEMDAIVTIGQKGGVTTATNTMRYLNVVKNKLPVPGNPALRHGKHEVLLYPQYALFKDLGRSSV